MRRLTAAGQSHQMLAASSQAPWWSAVAAALAGAVIVGLVGYLVARKEREAAAERLSRQLYQDRILREGEIRAESKRLDRQLQQDRELREATMVHAADRLDRQLAHDRQLRDLEHVRAVLGPISMRLLELNVVTDTRALVHRAGKGPRGEREKVLVPHLERIKETHAQLARDKFALGVIVGQRVPLTTSIYEVILVLDALADAMVKWHRGSLSDDQFDEVFGSITNQHNEACRHFLGAADETVGWAGPTEQDAL